MGQKQKTEKKERKRERLNNGDNNGQATHGARKHAWRTQAAWANSLFYPSGTFLALFALNALFIILSQKNIAQHILSNSGVTLM